MQPVSRAQSVAGKSASPACASRLASHPRRQAQASLRPSRPLWVLCQERMCGDMSRWCATLLLSLLILSNLSARLSANRQRQSVASDVYRRSSHTNSHPSSSRASRFVLASTQDLHEKISELSNRVRELEDGLRASHNMHSTDTHPLLSEDLLRIKAPIQREGLSMIANGSPDEQGDVVDTFGSLAISDTGRTNYFGQATSSFVRQ